MKKILLLLSLAILVQFAAATVTIDTTFVGDNSHFSVDQTTEQGSNLMKFGTINGTYLEHAYSADLIHQGLSKYEYSSQTGPDHTSNMGLKSVGYVINYETAGLASDSIGNAFMICDGGFPESQNSVITTGFTGKGNDDLMLQYNSDLSIVDTDMSVRTSKQAPEGMAYSDFQSEIMAGKNRESNTLQYHEQNHEHEFDSSNGTSGFNRTSDLVFEGYNYQGRNLPTEGVASNFIGKIDFSSPVNCTEEEFENV